jgi:hypothetical protein
MLRLMGFIGAIRASRVLGLLVGDWRKRRVNGPFAGLDVVWVWSCCMDGSHVHAYFGILGDLGIWSLGD